jgi:hypothetical protein
MQFSIEFKIRVWKWRLSIHLSRRQLPVSGGEAAQAASLLATISDFTLQLKSKRAFEQEAGLWLAWLQEDRYADRND